MLIATHRYSFIYRCPTVTCFDGESLLILVFMAWDRQHIRDQDCPVLCILSSVYDPNLRYNLFRAATSQLRRAQASSAPNVNIDGFTRQFTWWSGKPFWVNDAYGTVHETHPNNYNRWFDRQTGAWFWKVGEADVRDTEACW
jgi:hypothetical protein